MPKLSVIIPVNNERATIDHIVNLVDAVAIDKEIVIGMNSEILFAGAQGGFVGLDQLNLRLIRALIGKGVVNIVITVDGIVANTVTISIAGPPVMNQAFKRIQSAVSGDG